VEVFQENFYDEVSKKFTRYRAGTPSYSQKETGNYNPENLLASIVSMLVLY